MVRSLRWHTASARTREAQQAGEISAGGTRPHGRCMGRIRTVAWTGGREVIDMGLERGRLARVSKLINIVVFDYLGVMRQRYHRRV